MTAVPFLVELETHVLCGTHDIDRLMGPVELYQAEEKTPFEGLRGDEVHTYPGDVTGRDAGGIIFSMIAGADERTCAGGKPPCVLPRLRRARTGTRRTAQRADAHGGIRSAPREGCADRVGIDLKTRGGRSFRPPRVYGEVRKSSGESVLPGKFQMQSVFTAAIQGQLLTNLAVP